MIWSMVWAGTTAFITGAIMCYTVGWEWESRLDQISAYLSWFMDATGSVYGGGVFCCIIMMGLNVRLQTYPNPQSRQVVYLPCAACRV